MEGIVHVELNVSVDILSTGRGQEGEQKDKSRLSLDYGEHYGVLKWWYIVMKSVEGHKVVELYMEVAVCSNLCISKLMEAREERLKAN